MTPFHWLFLFAVQSNGRIFHPNGRSVKRNSVTARCLKRTHHTTPFWRPSAHARGNVLFRSAAIACGMFRINHRENFAYHLLIWLKYRQYCKTFWVTLVYSASHYVIRLATLLLIGGLQAGVSCLTRQWMDARI